ncbi:hypothetical protein GCM10007390_09630 [Persicitalea jodogahamensis]|uniref:Secretion system C-terminal sorting domain-containing protein n=2 Tax=Persicitalea jodogahamensis TaxID=402147 RepID=A0A8J3G8V6_9BACT|nr:hypothetical protein GCM10007390_09630 [Persicitalea jodogahamensis]
MPRARAAVLLLLLSFLMTPALAITLYVDAARSDDSGDGLSWATAHKYLPTALAAAQSGDQIWVAQGIYKPTTSTTDRGATMALKEGVAIYGGFTSGQMNLTDRNIDPETNNTILSGDIDNDGTLENNSYFIFVNNGALSSSALLDGFTLTGINTPTSFTRGGTIWLQSPSADTPCSPYIAHCLFRDNYAGNNGAASFVDANSSPQFVNCTFRNNSTGVFGSYGYGAAIYVSGGYGTTTKPKFINCAFQSNRAGWRGGAISIDQGGGGGEATVTLINCSFQGNRSGFPGNAIYKAGSGPIAILTNCVFWDNGGSIALHKGGTTANAIANYCLIEADEADYTGSNNMTATVNPFVSLTSTMLRVCSPAIDAGSDAAYEGPATDLANNPRTVRTIDMGAYEFQSALPVIVATLSGNPLLTPSESDGLRVSISDGTAPYTIVYSDGSSNYTVSNYQSGDNIPVAPAQPTTYTLVSVTDANGCVGTASGSVTVQDARCGNKNQNVTICYYGVTQCVSEKIAERYLKLGATLGGCGTGNARIGAEETNVPLQLSLQAYPNPVQDVVTLEVLAPTAGMGTFEVLDLTGRTRQSRSENLVEGLNEVGFRLGTLPTGMYLIRVTDAMNRQGVVKVKKE